MPTDDTRYLVETKDPTDPARTVELLLPRAEVQQSLLKDFEKRLLVRRTDHRNLRSRPMQVKGPRRTAKWLKPRYECAKAKAKPQKTTFRCPVDKDFSDPSERRKTTGGILTCVTSCGFLADYVEMWRGPRPNFRHTSFTVLSCRHVLPCSFALQVNSLISSTPSR